MVTTRSGVVEGATEETVVGPAGTGSLVGVGELVGPGSLVAVGRVVVAPFGRIVVGTLLGVAVGGGPGATHASTTTRTPPLDTPSAPNRTLTESDEPRTTDPAVTAVTALGAPSKSTTTTASSPVRTIRSFPGCTDHWFSPSTRSSHRWPCTSSGTSTVARTTEAPGAPCTAPPTGTVRTTPLGTPGSGSAAAGPTPRACSQPTVRNSSHVAVSVRRRLVDIDSGTETPRARGFSSHPRHHGAWRNGHDGPCSSRLAICRPMTGERAASRDRPGSRLGWAADSR